MPGAGPNSSECKPHYKNNLVSDKYNLNDFSSISFILTWSDYILDSWHSMSYSLCSIRNVMVVRFLQYLYPGSNTLKA